MACIALSAQKVLLSTSLILRRYWSIQRVAVALRAKDRGRVARLLAAKAILDK